MEADNKSLGYPLSSKPSYRRVLAALEESEERYRVLVEGVARYAIFMMDPAGIIVTWNRGIFELLGYRREEIVGNSGGMVFSLVDQSSGAFKKELAEAQASGEIITERSNLHKDGSEVLVHDTATSLHDSSGSLIGFAKVTRRRDIPGVQDSNGNAPELATALANLQIEVEHRRRLEAQLLTAVEEERERLGRDLHDDLSQRLAGISMMASVLTNQAPDRSPQDSAKMRQICDLLADAVNVARNLARGLHPVTLTTRGLPTALAELAERVPTQVKFGQPSTTEIRVDPSIGLHVYRIAEEAVGNSIRHSDATEISVQLKKISASEAQLTVSDNGKGFSRDEGPPGMGLQNMKYRAGVIGGTIEIKAAPRQGTTIRCTLPLLV